VLTLTEFVILSLAAGRITQFAVWDSLLDPARHRLDVWAAGTEANPGPHAARLFLLKLIGCPLCLGFWISGAVLASYLLASGQWAASELWIYGLMWWAVAMGQSLSNFALDKLSS
jgi:hypothetical protein